MVAAAPQTQLQKPQVVEPPERPRRPAQNIAGVLAVFAPPTQILRAWLVGHRHLTRVPAQTDEIKRQQDVAPPADPRLNTPRAKTAVVGGFTPKVARQAVVLKARAAELANSPRQIRLLPHPSLFAVAPPVACPVVYVLRARQTQRRREPPRERVRPAALPPVEEGRVRANQREVRRLVRVTRPCPEKT